MKHPIDANPSFDHHSAFLEKPVGRTRIPAMARYKLSASRLCLLFADHHY
jgi:hypothetical protein